jgi:hypothetical protein
LAPYIQRFYRFLLSISLRADWVSRAVSPSERISRFVMYRKWLDGAGRVTSAAFMPSSARTVSVYRTSKCAEKRIWLLGLLFVERKRRDSRKILGRADVRANVALQEGLRIRPLLTPHPRHAELIDWPEEKEAQKDKALALALASEAFTRPEPGRRDAGPHWGV